MKDSQAEFAEFWDDVAEKPKCTIDPEAARLISENFEKEVQSRIPKGE